MGSTEGGPPKKPSLNERAKALEDSFFRDLDQRRAAELRKRLEKEASLDELKTASGIGDRALLEELAGAGISAGGMAALSLAPIVAVAWADGSMEEGERRALLRAAEQYGLKKGETGYLLLEGWLSTRPGPELMNAWRSYVRHLTGEMAPDRVGRLKAELLERARSVAGAAGGFLGLGSKISKEEREVLREIEEAFP